MTGDIMTGLARRAREPIGMEQQQQAAQQLAELAAQWVSGGAQGRPAQPRAPGSIRRSRCTRRHVLSAWFGGERQACRIVS